MKKHGNPNQWNNESLQKELLRKDVQNQTLIVIEEKGIVHACFAFMIGKDPTYAYIEKGKWMDDTQYGTIHRIMSDQKIHGVFHEACAFCFKQIGHIRIDTHEDNRIMQKCILKEGFVYCGIITIADGTKRLAYEKSLQ